MARPSVVLGGRPPRMTRAIYVGIFGAWIDDRPSRKGFLQPKHPKPIALVAGGTCRWSQTARGRTVRCAKSTLACMATPPKIPSFYVGVVCPVSQATPPLFIHSLSGSSTPAWECVRGEYEGGRRLFWTRFPQSVTRSCPPPKPASPDPCGGAIIVV